MPVVFVHGVGTRTSPEYWVDREVRTRLIREFLFPPLNLPPSANVHFAYWGDHGADFRWGHASLPSGGEEALGGSADEALVELVGEYLDVQSSEEGSFLLGVARRHSLTEAIDLMVAAAAAGSTAQQAADLVALVQTVEGLMAAGDERPPPWLDDIESDLDLLEALSARAPSARDEDDDEAFGRTGRGWIRLREGLSRFRTAIPAATGRAAGRVVRPRIHDQAATFVGDILVYLDRAGSAGATSKILTSVGDTIEQASQERSAADPLVVLAHSMGGNIVYDLLSYFKPDLDVDTLVTVGSQVGLFQELDLFAAKHPALNPPADKVPRPDNIGRWINIYDRNDVLGFAVGRVFDGVTDFEYSTGLGFVKAHSGYFIRPSFYRRLAARLVA